MIIEHRVTFGLDPALLAAFTSFTREFVTMNDHLQAAVDAVVGKLTETENKLDVVTQAIPSLVSGAVKDALAAAGVADEAAASALESATAGVDAHVQALLDAAKVSSGADTTGAPVTGSPVDTLLGGQGADSVDSGAA